MEYPTKSTQLKSSSIGNDKCELKAPYIELADKAFDDFIQMDHQHMVEAFKYLQKRLCDTRYEQNQNMKCVLESHAKDIESHAIGTDLIASAL